MFKVELTDGSKAAFKIHAKKIRDRYKGEIAAYRLAEALGIHNVPPACYRSYDAKAFLAVLDEDAKKVFADEAIDVDGRVKGALIPWIEGLGFVALEKPPLRSDMVDWLDAAKPIPPEKEQMAREISTMIVFDFLTTNWDRYSGGNVGQDTKNVFGMGKDALLYIDNDAAFMDKPPNIPLAGNRSRLDKTQRFSKSFVEKVSDLDERKIAIAMGEEEPGKPLLEREAIKAAQIRVQIAKTVVQIKERSIPVKELYRWP